MRWFGRVAVLVCVMVGLPTGAVAVGVAHPAPASIRIVSGADRPPLPFVGARGRLRGYEAGAWQPFQQPTGAPVGLEAMAWDHARRVAPAGQPSAIDLIGHTSQSDAAFAYSSRYASMPPDLFVDRRPAVHERHGWRWGSLVWRSY